MFKPSTGSSCWVWQSMLLKLSWIQKAHLLKNWFSRVYGFTICSSHRIRCAHIYMYIYIYIRLYIYILIISYYIYYTILYYIIILYYTILYYIILYYIILYYIYLFIYLSMFAGQFITLRRMDWHDWPTGAGPL